LHEFRRQFATEEACEQYLEACRWPDGFVCPRCSHRRAYVVAHRRRQCTACRHQVSLTADKRGVSALFIQRQLGVRRYETAWMMLHKLRRAMVNATRERLHGDIELDDTWIGGPQAGIKGSRQLKDRRAVPVLVAVERREDRSGRIRLLVLPDFTAAAMNALIQEHVDAGSTVYTDGLGAFAGLKTAGYRHIALKQPLRSALRKGAAAVVPLADRVVGNLQNWLIGTHHGVSRPQLQAYLEEFVFRHNRRKQPMAAFQTLLGLSTARTPTPYRRIHGGRDMLKRLGDI
jgi:transposase-like protein